MAEMVALLGPPPPEIMQRYQYMREYPWPEPVRRKDDRLCETAEEYFDGPFFDNNGIMCFFIRRFTDYLLILGRFIYEDLIPNRTLDDAVSFLDEAERDNFVDLVKKILVWHPNKRRTAGELAAHPFFQTKQTIT